METFEMNTPLLSRLSAPPQPHPYRELFLKYPAPAIAEELNCCVSHLYSVLRGRFKPSSSMDKAMATLAEQIRTEEAGLEMVNIS